MILELFEKFSGRTSFDLSRFSAKPSHNRHSCIVNAFSMYRTNSTIFGIYDKKEKNEQQTEITSYSNFWIPCKVPLKSYMSINYIGWLCCTPWCYALAYNILHPVFAITLATIYKTRFSPGFLHWVGSRSDRLATSNSNCWISPCYCHFWSNQSWCIVSMSYVSVHLKTVVFRPITERQYFHTLSQFAREIYILQRHTIYHYTHLIKSKIVLISMILIYKFSLYDFMSLVV